MPCIDMPLEELKKYKGISPKPADFDEYWDKAIAEMESIDPQIEIKESAFQGINSACYDLYFTGAHGARVHCKYALPRKYEGKLPMILMFHGYSGKSPEFDCLLRFTGEGYAVLALDARGQAGESEDNTHTMGNTLNGHIIRGLEDDDPENLYFRQVFLDTAQIAKIAHDMEHIDSDRIYATGGSQGGALTVSCIALSPYVKKAVPIYPFLSDYKRVWDMDMDMRAYAELRTHFRNFDPNHAREDEIFTKLGYIDLHHLAPRIKTEVKMLTGLMDDVCPPSTQFAIYNNLTCKKDMVLYPDFGHEGLPKSELIIMEFFRD